MKASKPCPVCADGVLPAKNEMLRKVLALIDYPIPHSQYSAGVPDKWEMYAIYRFVVSKCKSKSKSKCKVSKTCKEVSSNDKSKMSIV